MYPRIALMTGQFRVQHCEDFDAEVPCLSSVQTCLKKTKQNYRDHFVKTACFPKDLNSLIVQMESNGINADMLKSVWSYNQKIRTVIDWAVT